MSKAIDTTISQIERAIEKRRSTSVRVGPHKIKIYAGKKRERYTICWYEGMKRERRETTNPDVVLETAKDLITAWQLSKAAASNLPPERLQEYVEVDSVLAGVNLSTLVQFYKEHVSQQNKSVSDVRFEYLKAGVENSLRHQDSVRLHLEKFCKTFRGSIGRIRALEIDEYLKKNFAHQKTRLNHRITICSMFRFAQRKGYLPAGFTEAEKSERPRIPITEPGIISANVLNALLKHCKNKDRKLKSFLVIGAFAGCRASEIQRLKWGDIRGDSIILGPSITKTRRRRIAEIPENLQAWIEVLRGEEDEYVTYPEKSFYYLYEKLNALCEASGISWKKNCLRHSFVSCHLELHRDPPRTSKTAGHSLNMLETSYLKLVDHSEAEAYFSILPPKESLEDSTESPDVQAAANQSLELCPIN